MRARTVILKRAFIFDFDDTLVTTTAKVHIIKNRKKIYSLTPSDYNFYEPKQGESIDVSDFEDPRLIMQAKKGKMWKLLNNVYVGNKLHITDSDIFILTARNEKAQIPIHNYLKRAKIDIPIDQIICVSSSSGDYVNIEEEKEKILLEINKYYDQISFFDDSIANINSAKNIPGIKTRLVEKNK